MSSGTGIIPAERIERAILLLRGEKVLLDRDLARLYGVSTSNLNKAVSRNFARFPQDFMFTMTGLVLAIFAAENAAPPKADVSLAEELRAADLEYRGELEDILRRAEMQDDKAVKADVEKRRAVTAQYQSAGAKRVERTLTVTGNLQNPAEFVMYPDSVGLISFSDRPNPSLITLNDQPWTRWDSEKMPVSIDQIIRWRVTTAPGVAGKVVGRLYPRAAGIRSIRLEAFGYTPGSAPPSPLPFTLQIVYKAKAVGSPAQPEKQAEPVVGK